MEFNDKLEAFSWQLAKRGIDISGWSSDDLIYVITLIRNFDNPMLILDLNCSAHPTAETCVLCKQTTEHLNNCEQ